MLIDFNALHIKYCLAYKNLYCYERPTGGIYGWFKSIFYHSTMFKIDSIIFFLDGVRAKQERRVVFPNYKIQRPKIMFDGITEQRNLMMLLLSELNLKVMCVEHLEADQLVARVASKIASENKVLIVTNDKDYVQLLDKNISIYMMYPYESVLFNDAKSVFKRFGVYPEQLVDLLCISGDSSDNIPGVPGIGLVGARKLLNQYQNLENIYSNLDSLTTKQRNALLSSTEELKVYRSLIDLNDEQVDCHISWTEVDNYLKNFSIKDLKQTCLQNKFFTSKMHELGINVWKL